LTEGRGGSEERGIEDEDENEDGARYPTSDEGNREIVDPD
jgi:hypothetical protein